MTAYDPRRTYVRTRDHGTITIAEAAAIAGKTGKVVACCSPFREDRSPGAFVGVSNSGKTPFVRDRGVTYWPGGRR